jgi:hypothetical protein
MPEMNRFMTLIRGEPVIVNGIVNALVPTPAVVPRMNRFAVEVKIGAGVPRMYKFILSLLFKLPYSNKLIELFIGILPPTNRDVFLVNESCPLMNNVAPRV